jgi:hypothetical protein
MIPLENHNLSITLCGLTLALLPKGQKAGAQEVAAIFGNLPILNEGTVC